MNAQSSSLHASPWVPLNSSIQVETSDTFNRKISERASRHWHSTCHWAFRASSSQPTGAISLLEFVLGGFLECEALL